MYKFFLPFMSIPCGLFTSGLFTILSLVILNYHMLPTLQVCTCWNFRISPVTVCCSLPFSDLSRLWNLQTRTQFSSPSSQLTTINALPSLICFQLLHMFMQKQNCPIIFTAVDCHALLTPLHYHYFVALVMDTQSSKQNPH
jgi:hypothetical protein